LPDAIVPWTSTSNQNARFVGFFECDADPRDKFSLGPGSTRRPIIRADTRSGSQQLTADDLRFLCVRQRADECQDIERELLCSPL